MITSERNNQKPFPTPLTPWDTFLFPFLYYWRPRIRFSTFSFQFQYQLMNQFKKWPLYYIQPRLDDLKVFLT